MARYTVVEEPEHLVITVAEQGPPGISGTGYAIISEVEPSIAAEGEIWFNPITKIEKIYAGGTWQDTYVDGLYF